MPATLQTMHMAVARFAPIVLAIWLVGCAEAQMRYNVLSYDDAIADSANELLLLNAVRASQRYPMSFTSVGQIYAGPQVSGSLMGTMNFSNPVGLTTSSFTPNISTISPGYSQFTLDNLNSKEFMELMRKPVSASIISSFFASNWPQELVNLIYIQSLGPDQSRLASIDRERKAICITSTTERASRLCSIIEEDLSMYGARCSDHFSNTDIRLRQFKEDPGIYYNTTASYCHFLRFQIVLREFRLLRIKACPPEKRRPDCIPATYRSALQMVQFLGELISAQHYIEVPFNPEVLIGHSTPDGRFEFVRVPLFEVRRDLPGITRAVIRVRHEANIFYIPRPEYGSPAEARSLQAMDLVLQSIRAATTKQDIPKGSPAVSIVGKQ
jgi:hypothetical protein